MDDDSSDHLFNLGRLSILDTGHSVPPGFDGASSHFLPAFAPTPTPAATSDTQLQLNTSTMLGRAPPPGLSPAVGTPEQTSRKPATPCSSEAKKTIKALAADGGLSKEIPSLAQPHAEAERQNTLLEEDFPALNAPKSGQQPEWPSTGVQTPKGTSVSKKEKMASRSGEARMGSPAAQEVATPKGESRKPLSSNAHQPTLSPPPGKTADSSAGAEKTASAFPPLPVPAQSPSAPKAAPKTLRVIPTSKTEAPPMASPVSAISRAMSLSHASPDTPPGELASDTASMVSASMSASRAGSPPPSRVGAAAVRQTTKSQQRKQRKEALKQDTKLISEAPKVEPEVHAPIVGRKKKQKKEKPVKASAGQAKVPGVVTPEGSTAALKVKEDSAPQVKNSTQTPTAYPAGSASKEKTPEMPDKTNSKERPTAVKTFNRSLIAPETKTSRPPPVETGEEPNVEETGPPDSSELGPAGIYSEIKEQLWSDHACRLQMFKAIPSVYGRGHHGDDHSSALSNPKAAGTSLCRECGCKCGEITDRDIAALRAGDPVRKQFHVDGSRMLVTPNGDCVRGLSSEEEDTFLRLQESIAADAENPGSFVFQRHQPGNGAFSLIKGRAVPNGRPNIFPATSQMQPQDPIGKLQREDALSYINQYVLPRLNLGPTSVGWNKGTSLRQDAAAASLNSLAPYFYGPDAAAGVGIYSAPDYKDFSPVSSALAPPGGEDPARGGSNGGGVGGMPLMSVADAEAALGSARKDTDKLEKKLNSLIKSNRRMLISGSCSC